MRRGTTVPAVAALVVVAGRAGGGSSSGVPARSAAVGPVGWPAPRGVTEAVAGPRSGAHRTPARPGTASRRGTSPGGRTCPTTDRFTTTTSRPGRGPVVCASVPRAAFTGGRPARQTSAGLLVATGAPVRPVDPGVTVLVGPCGIRQTRHPHIGGGGRRPDSVGRNRRDPTGTGSHASKGLYPHSPSIPTEKRSGWAERRGRTRRRLTPPGRR